MNVARAWTMAWALMKEVRIPDALPEDFVRKHQSALGQEPTLSDPPYKTKGAPADQARQLAESVVAGIKKNIFPLVGA